MREYEREELIDLLHYIQENEDLELAGSRKWPKDPTYDSYAVTEMVVIDYICDRVEEFDDPIELIYSLMRVGPYDKFHSQVNDVLNSLLECFDNFYECDIT